MLILPTVKDIKVYQNEEGKKSKKDQELILYAFMQSSFAQMYS